MGLLQGSTVLHAHILCTSVTNVVPTVWEAVAKLRIPAVSLIFIHIDCQSSTVCVVLDHQCFPFMLLSPHSCVWPGEIRLPWQAFRRESIHQKQPTLITAVFFL